MHAIRFDVKVPLLVYVGGIFELYLSILGIFYFSSKSTLDKGLYI